MSRRHANPLHNPLHYATRQMHVGPPASYATAQRTLIGYDYVIVGAGAAGCVLASKLSEDPNVSVLVLEAGGDNSKILESKIPILFGKLFHGEHDWNYYTTEQPGVASRSLYWPRGRVLGGSTSINAQIYHHCSKSDFDEWALEYGCKGWSYDDLAPYFRRMEKFTPNPARPAIDAKRRGDAGEWQTGYSWLCEITEKGFLRACLDADIPTTEDANVSDAIVGVTPCQTFIDRTGQRSSLATAFLSPAVMRRPNLFVACHARVSRILFDRVSGKEPTAIGVEFQTSRDGDRFEVHARREVILSGGSINTPQTLLLSGIGPADELKKHGISVVRESDAVGRNLKDHLCPTAIICKAKSGTTLDYLGNTLKALPALARWMIFGTGPLTSNVGEAMAFLRTAEREFPPARYGTPKDHGSCGVGPDVEILGAPISYVHHGEETAPNGGSIFSLVSVGLRPQSKGTITLQSTNVFDAPIIDPKYYSDEGDNDRHVMMTGLRVALRIMRSPALSKYFEPVPVNDDPSSYWWPYSSSDIERITDEQLLRFMDEKAFTLYHPVGTARMGPSPANSVVDPQCRVHGVGHLRIMDASICPDQLSGHPTAPIGAMAYKVSDMIKESYQAVDGAVRPNL